MPRKIVSRGSSTLAEGIYQVAIVDSKEGTSKSGNDMITLSISAISNGKPIGKLFNDHLVFTPETQWKFDNLNAALEIPEGKEFDYRFYKGKKCYARIGIEEYNGADQNKIRGYFTNDAGRAKMIEQNGSVDDFGGDDSADGNSADFDVAPVAAPTRTANQPQEAAAQGRKRRPAPDELSGDESFPL